MSAGGSKQKSNPVNMTPSAFQNLQSPFANVLASLLGAGQAGSAFGSNFTGNQNTNTNTQSGFNPNEWQIGRIGGEGGSDGNGGYQGLIRRSQKDLDREIMVQNMFNPANRNSSNTNTSTSQNVSSATNGTTPGGGDALAGIPQYQGPLTAQLGENEQAILDQLMANATGGGSAGGNTGSPAQDYLINLLTQGSPYTQQYDGPDQGLGDFAQELAGAAQTEGYDPNGNNPFVTAAIEAATRPILQNLEETLTRTLPGRFTQAGQFIQPQGSSAFDRAAALSSRGAAQEIGDISSDISFRSFEAERGRQFEAEEGARARENEQLARELERRGQFAEAERARAGAAQENQANRQLEAAQSLPQINAQETQTLIDNLQAQALPRLIEDLGIERGLDQFNTRVNNLLTTLGIAAGVTRPVISQESKGSSAQVGIK